QGYWFAALEIASVLALFLGRPGTAFRLARRARRLKRRFDRDFWLPEEGFLAFGLDADKRPVRTPVSNAGHCLASGIVARRRVPQLVERLFAPDLFSGWGIRTLSADNPSYNPLSYHLGSVWPVENGTILLGLRRYGCDARALELATALRDLAALWPGGRVPECVGGHPRGAAAHPGSYARANAPQAWNQSVWPLLVQSLLGLQPLAPLGALGVDPILPEWLPELEVRGLRVGGGEVDLRFHRDRRGRSRFAVLARRGRRLRVVRQPPVNDLGVGPLGRLGALLRRS
ncbi:MAG TPA: amylo-alpha-1,6-glucosidase, partial [Thermoanaerobaculia bacterium]